MSASDYRDSKGYDTQYQLPVQAAVDGPKICFRLLDVDDGSSIRHEQYVALMIGATDNRMTLEAVEEAWQRHVDIQRISNDGHQDSRAAIGSAHDQAAAALRLPAFLRAFDDLAVAKYSDKGLNHGKTGVGSVNRLLLRDIFCHSGKGNPETTLQGYVRHLVQHDVCSFLLSQKSFTTDLYGKYVSDQPSTSATHAHAMRPEQVQERSDQFAGTWERAVASSQRMCWADFLAVASELNVVPSLIGIDVLKAIMTQVSSAPHRRGGETAGFSPCLGSNENPVSKGIFYPQFVEALTLLASYTADRLRSLYPDIAGPKPIVVASPGVATSHGVKTKRDCPSNFSPRGQEQQQAEQNDKDRSSVRRRTTNAVGAVVRMRHGRSAASPKLTTPLLSGQSSGNDADNRANEFQTRGMTEAEVPFSAPFDVGALQALFHHARAAQAGKNGLHERDSSWNRHDVNLESLSETEQSSQNLDENVDEGGTGIVSQTARDFTSGAARAEAIISHTEIVCVQQKPKVYKPANIEGLGKLPAGRQELVESTDLQARVIVDDVHERVNELWSYICPPSLTSKEVTTEESYNKSGQAICGSILQADSSARPALGVGGRFARLVVIKELQLVPEHAPDDALPLLELALDHQQAGRFTLALETLEKATAVWGNTPLAAEGSRPLSSGPESIDVQKGEGGLCQLNPTDQVLKLLLKASIHQTAGQDSAALSTLLRANTALGSVQASDDGLRETLMASMLNEIGVIVYYCNLPVLALECFRLALILRYRPTEQQLDRPDEDVKGVFDGPGATNGQPPEVGTDPTLGSVAAGSSAAIALNNVGVCLASVGSTETASQALAISASLTSAVLGIQHPRSAVMARNLEIVRAVGRNTSFTKRRDTVSSHVGVVSETEMKLWRSLGSRSRRSVGNYPNNAKATGSHQHTRDGMSRVISGGFVFAGRLPHGGGAIIRTGGKKKRGKRAKGTGTTKREKSAGRR